MAVALLLGLWPRVSPAAMPIITRHAGYSDHAANLHPGGGTASQAAAPLQPAWGALIPAADRIKPALGPHTAARADAPSHLRCQWLRDPIGIQQLHPLLTWQPPQRSTLGNEWFYQIQVTDSPDRLQAAKSLIWDSGKQQVNRFFLPEYHGPKLAAFTKYFWRVRVWGDAGWKSQWSHFGSFTSGPLVASEWRGSWITYHPHVHNVFYSTAHNAYFGLPLPKKRIHAHWRQTEPCPIFRKIFRVPGGLQHASMYIAALGYWTLRINGKKVGPGELESTLYNYSKTVPFQTFDVTALLHKRHRNVVTVALGNGWYNLMERDVWGWQHARWRAWPRVLMNLRMTTSKGLVKTVATNTSWQAAPGPRLADGEYNGEVYSAATVIPGWNNPRAALLPSAHAVVGRPPAGILKSQLMPPCEIMHTFSPVSVTQPQRHVFVVKFPINMAGWVTLTARGRPGVPVVLRYAEEINAQGLADRSSISGFAFTGSFQTDTYIPDRRGVFTYHPHFGYNGFQYVQINGLASRRDLISIQADFIHTAFHRGGVFWSGNALLNAISVAAGHSYCSNFMGYPTDCPTREKNGWTGDAWLAAVQGILSYHNPLGYSKWLNDCANTQSPNGGLRVIMPDPTDWDWGTDPDWESAMEFITWYDYEYYGNGRIIKEHYNGIKRYFLLVFSLAKNDVLPDGAGIGDWDSAAKHRPSVAFSSTCILYHDARRLVQMAHILHKPRDAHAFLLDARAIRSAFNKRFYKGGGVYENGGETAEAMPLYYRIVTKAQRAAVTKRLVNCVHQHLDHPVLGILGSKCLFRALSRYGHSTLAYRIATQTTYPSYGQWILHGATSLWENWGLHPGTKNHIMFGDVVGWMYNDLAGINPDPKDPGFRTILLTPHLVRALPWAGATYDSRFGTISSSWRWHGSQVSLRLEIPSGSTALVTLPNAGKKAIICNGKTLAPGGVGVLAIYPSQSTHGPATIDLASGRYTLFWRPVGIR